MTYLIHNFEPAHVGMDFNVGRMASACAELWKGKLYVLKEFTDLLDTPEMINAVTSFFGERKINAYPDSSGKHRSSNNAKSSDISLLRDATSPTGRKIFNIKARTINPPVRDRIASVNLAFQRKMIVINTQECPELTESLEQMIYDNYGRPDKSLGIDHITDALGYMVHWIMPVKSRAIVTTTVGQ